MDIEPNKIWTSKEWESYANDLLRSRYRFTDYVYVPIPDQDGGDGGIEGFSSDGFVYQMYCPEDATTTDVLFNKQRRKINIDIKKFIDNGDKLKSFFGSMKVKAWVLFVPSHKTSRIVSHATKKTEEILKKKLEYVDSSCFRILIWSRDDFKKEESDLLSSGVNTLKLDAGNVSDNDLVSCGANNPEFNENMHRKLSKLGSSNERVIKGQAMLSKQAILSQNMLSQLKLNYADYYSSITSAIETRAEQLDIEALDFGLSNNNNSLNFQIATLNGMIKNECRIHESNTKTIAQGTIADWLMNCTLDFD